MNITNHVRKGISTFSHYRAGNLYYLTDTGIEFPIPIEDTDGATFKSPEKTIIFMRWLRKHLETMENV